MHSETVSVARRFQRSIKIDSDHNDQTALEGFICPQSSADVLRSVAQHVSGSGHSAFTWTGPYGSGKSSLVVALSALLGGDSELRAVAKAAIGHETAGLILKGLPPKANGWLVVPVVGQRTNAANIIGRALDDVGALSRRKRHRWTDDAVLGYLAELVEEVSYRNHGGVVLFIDEMGKFLEAAAQDDTDIYLFQMLAEAASRSNGRFVIIGVLHQAFEDYANRWSREMRDEWSKIQGRFVDLAVNVAGEEQIELVSRAIENGHRPAEPSGLSQMIACEIKRRRPAASRHLAETLDRCWPLHPVVACLLGPISRLRFGQNQRSIFGFLNSAEPHGFQDFIHHCGGNELYEPNRLWDYLRVNLEPSILVSPVGHRWAMATEAVERCEALGGSELELGLLKTIALVDLVKDRSGLLPTESFLAACFVGTSKAKVRVALGQLKDWSLVIFRKFADAYAIFAGSDFDIDGAIDCELQNVREVDFAALQELAGLQPILAKRHYHDTGALRWLDVEVSHLHGLSERIRAYKSTAGAIGTFVLAIPTEGESHNFAKRVCRTAVQESKDWDVVVGLSERAWIIVDLAKELIALVEVQVKHPDLPGDAIAQREVVARKTALQARLEEELRNAFDQAVWYLKDNEPQTWDLAEINNAASGIADKRFSLSPRINNELLNRMKPSNNAVAAQNVLLRAMVDREGEPRLGIDGYPAEGGLFASILEATALYGNVDGQWQFLAPQKKHDPGNLVPIWSAAAKFLKEAKDRTVSVSDLYDLWGAPPYGLKQGLKPVMAVAFILTNKEHAALYREGIFQTRLKDIDVEILAKNADQIQLRWMDLSGVPRRLLSCMAEVVRELDAPNRLACLAPIDVARSLIAIFDQLHPWTKRTTQLSSKATRVRDLFKLANDPNKFLFDDIPATFGRRGELDEEKEPQAIVNDVRDGLIELTLAYPSMLRRLHDLMLTELQVPNDSPQALGELRERAANIRGIGDDFRLNAFISRLSQYGLSERDLEGIASLVANKPPRDWTDPDLDRTSVGLADMAQKFIRAENFARVKGRMDKRSSMAVVVGLNGRPVPFHAEFEVAESEKEIVEEIIKRLEGVIDTEDPTKRHLLLAALAEFGSRYMVNEEIEGERGEAQIAAP